VRRRTTTRRSSTKPMRWARRPRVPSRCLAVRDGTRVGRTRTARGRSRRRITLGDFSWVERYKAYYAHKQA
jgi:hypothetical protein